MFEFAKNVKIQKAQADFVVGVLAEPLPHYKRSEPGALCVAATSVRAFMDGIIRELPEPKRAKESVSYGWPGGFHYFESWTKASDTFRNHPEKVRNFNVMDKDIKVPDSMGNEVSYDIEGDWLDVDRFLIGEPECFGELVNGNPNNLFATIVVNLHARCDFSETAMRRRGERLVRLVDWLENQKIRTNIIAYGSNPCYHAEVVVKRFEDSFDIDSLAVVSHPDFFRRFFFRVIEWSDTYRSNYGPAPQVYNGDMSMPEIESNGILIFTENRISIPEIDAVFDKAEADIERLLGEGDKNFSINC